MSFSWRYPITLLALISAGVGLAFLSGRSVPAPDRAASVRGVVYAHGDSLLPSDTLQDLVTYGDVLAEIEVGETTTLPADPSDIGNAYTPRSTTIQVHRVLWSRSLDVQQPPDSLTLSFDGVANTDDGGRTIVRPEGEPELAQSGHYVMVLTHLVPSERIRNAQWIPLGYQIVLPVGSNGILQEPVFAGVTNGSPKSTEGLRETLVGKSVTAFASLLSRTSPYAAAAPYMNEPPDMRYVHANN